MKLPLFVSKASGKLVRFRPTKRFAISLGYLALFSVLFFFFLFWTLPVNQFAPNIESLVSGTIGRTVRIGEIATSATGAVVVSGLEIGVKEDDEEDKESKSFLQGKNGRSESEKKSDAAPKPRLSPKYFFDEIKVNIGFLSALFGTLDADAQIAGLGGKMEMSYEGAFPKMGDKAAEASSKSKKAKSKAARKRKGKKEDKEQKNDESGDEDAEDSDEDGEDAPLAFYLKAEDINLKLVHDLRAALPVPLRGTLNLEADLSSSTSGLADASGKISFSIRNLLLSKKGYEATIFGSSLAVPPLAVSSIEGEIVFKNGKGQVTSFKVVSKHIDISLEGEITLGDTVKTCKTDLYTAFKIKDGYLAQSDAIRTIMESADTFSSKARRAHRDDGYYGFRYQGAFGKGRFTPAKEFSLKGKKSTKKSSKSSKRKRHSRRTAKKTPAKPPAEKNTVKRDNNNAASSPSPGSSGHQPPPPITNKDVKTVNRPSSPAHPPLEPSRRRSHAHKRVSRAEEHGEEEDEEHEEEEDEEHEEEEDEEHEEEEDEEHEEEEDEEHEEEEEREEEEEEREEEDEEEDHPPPPDDEN